MPALHLDEKNFRRLVLEEKTTALVDFWSPRCGPCRMIAPILDQVSDEVPEGTLVAKVNTDEEGSLAHEYDIMYIPTIIAFRDGQEVRRHTGLTDQNGLLDLLK